MCGGEYLLRFDAASALRKAVVMISTDFICFLFVLFQAKQFPQAVYRLLSCVCINVLWKFLATTAGYGHIQIIPCPKLVNGDPFRVEWHQLIWEKKCTVILLPYFYIDGQPVDQVVQAETGNGLQRYFAIVGGDKYFLSGL